MNDKKGSKNSNDSQDIQIARLAFIGASIATLGDAIAAVAAGLALEALEKSSNQNPGSSDEQSKHSAKMQQEIDYIINELKQIKKTMK
jgi:hypothetical protein